MFAVELKDDCPHQNSVNEDAGLFLAQRTAIRENRCCSTHCPSALENWLCLHCFQLNCSRHVSGHAVEHFTANPSHSIGVSLADLSVWCYECDSYIKCAAAEPIISALHEDKFGEVPPNLLENTAEEKMLIEKHSNGRGNDNNNNQATSSDNKFGVPIDTTELQSDAEEIADACLQVADWLTASTRCVWFTGAGISTSVGIPDFRGPQGIWTRQQRGAKNVSVGLPLQHAKPSFTHEFLANSLRKSDCIISQNVDGLHSKSGVPLDQLFELHGNAFIEKCVECHKQHLRTFDTVDRRGTDKPTNVKHATGRACDDCKGALHDTIVSFGEQLPSAVLERSIELSSKCDLFIVLGSSLRVSPACDLPLLALDNGAKLVIVNKQPTPMDDKAHVVVHHDIDSFLQMIAD